MSYTWKSGAPLLIRMFGGEHLLSPIGGPSLAPRSAKRPCSGSPNSDLLRHKPQHLLLRQRPAEEVALGVVPAERLQNGHLLPPLHALGDAHLPEVLHERDGRVNHREHV